jgi:hypothetical protein
MRKIHKLLTDAAKDARHRQNLISIHITTFGWLVEFFGGFMLILGSFILGHGSSIVTLTLQTVTIFFYFNLLPCVLLINSSEFKEHTANNTFYVEVLKIFNCAKYNQIDIQEANEEICSNLNYNIGNNQDNGEPIAHRENVLHPSPSHEQNL